jgi:peptidoglycan/xylan/chitin deacetylase (PgdA/CDA1 family)
MISLIISSIIIGSVASLYFGQMKIAKWLYSKYNVKFNHGMQGDKTVCLTIDDVPYNHLSFSKILKTLDAHQIYVTFFIISSFVNADNIQLLISAVQSGHHLANHGKYDKQHTSLTYEELEEEIKDCEMVIDTIYELANEENKKTHDGLIEKPNTKYYRPGCGFVNQTIYEYCNKNNYTIVLGNVYPCDPQIPFGSINNMYILGSIRENDIIILHDRQWTADALDILLVRIKNKGYIVTSLAN